MHSCRKLQNKVILMCMADPFTHKQMNWPCTDPLHLNVFYLQRYSNRTKRNFAVVISEFHKLPKYEPQIKQFQLEVFVEQFVFGEVKCKMSAISPVRQQEFASESMSWGRFKLFLLWLTGMSAAQQPSTAAEITPHGVRAVCFMVWFLWVRMQKEHYIERNI